MYYRKVFSTPRCLVGIDEQDWSLLTPIFSIRNAANEEVLKIKGPGFCIYSMCGEDVKFNVILESLKNVYIPNLT